MQATKELKKEGTGVKERHERAGAKRVYSPPVDIIESRDRLVLIADMPGVDRDSVEITLEKNILTVYGTVKSEVPEGYWLISSEYGKGDYQRTFRLSNEIDREGIQAAVKNGVLRLTLPKAEAAKKRKIEIKAE